MTVHCPNCQGYYWATQRIQGGKDVGWNISHLNLVRCLKCDEEYVWDPNGTDLVVKRYFKWD